MAAGGPGPAGDQTDADILALEAFLPYRLNRAAELVSRGFARLYGERYGLTRPEWRCLATIGQFGRITATAIGTHSSMHKTKVSRAVRALEERKWLMREADPQDRRTEHLTLTPQGLKAYGELAEIARGYEAELMRALARDGEKLDRGLAGVERVFASGGKTQR